MWVKIGLFVEINDFVTYNQCKVLTFERSLTAFEGRVNNKGNVLVLGKEGSICTSSPNNIHN